MKEEATLKEKAQALLELSGIEEEISDMKLK